MLSRLIEKEHEAHTALGDVASLMGKYDVDAEEDEIRKVLAGKAELDDIVKDTQAVTTEDSIAGHARAHHGQRHRTCSETRGGRGFNCHVSVSVTGGVPD